MALFSSALRDAADGIAFVAQDTPLYKNLSVADMLHLTRNLCCPRTRWPSGSGWPTTSS
jgi:hypothetical protein